MKKIILILIFISSVLFGQVKRAPYQSSYTGSEMDSTIGHFIGDKYTRYVGGGEKNYPLTIAGIQAAISTLDTGLVYINPPGIADTSGLGAIPTTIELAGYYEGKYHKNLYTNNLLFESTKWKAFPSFPTTIDIRAFITYKGKLYLAAHGAEDGLYNETLIYRFNGYSWDSLYTPPVEGISSMEVYNNKLFIGGWKAGKVYTYNDTTWTYSDSLNYNEIRAMKVYNNKLYAGGSVWPAPVYVFDGSTWSVSNSDATSTDVATLEVFNGKLYAGEQNGKVLVYDGFSWTTSFASGDAYAASLKAFNGKLYVGTWSQGDVYEYDGISWTLSKNLPAGDVRLGIIYNGNLYCAHNNGQLYFYDKVTWGNAPLNVSPASLTTAQTVYNSKLLIGTSDGRIFYKQDLIDYFDFENDQHEYVNQPNWWDKRQSFLNNYVNRVQTTNISNPPTDAELDAAFPNAAVGETIYIDDNGANANFYIVVKNGTSTWWILTLAKGL